LRRAIHARRFELTGGLPDRGRKAGGLRRKQPSAAKFAAAFAPATALGISLRNAATGLPRVRWLADLLVGREVRDAIALPEYRMRPSTVSPRAGTPGRRAAIAHCMPPAARSRSRDRRGPQAPRIGKPG
jgi:hypothetical protein